MHSLTVVAVLLCALCAATASPVARDNQPHGSVHGGVQRDKGVGTSVHVNAQGDVWRSRDGTARVHAEGNYGRVVHGPARGRQDYNGMVTFEKKF